jgi:DNA topoisomerase-2
MVLLLFFYAAQMANLSSQYRKHTHREHILSLPDTYIGSVENTAEELFVVEKESFVQTTVANFNPGFYKLFDELLVNAHDHVVRLRQKKSDFPVKHIEISVIDGTSILMKNDGESIDVEKHPEYEVYIPQMIFGQNRKETSWRKKWLWCQACQHLFQETGVDHRRQQAPAKVHTNI